MTKYLHITADSRSHSRGQRSGSSDGTRTSSNVQRATADVRIAHSHRDTTSTALTSSSCLDGYITTGLSRSKASGYSNATSNTLSRLRSQMHIARGSGGALAANQG